MPIAYLKKDVIKFSWNFIKLEDTLAKQAAYMVTAYFISKYDTPVKIVTQIFVAILRTFQVESRYMVRQSLDLLAPIIPERMASTGAPNSWINWVRRVLSESNSNQNITLYQFLINHPDAFFGARSLFIPNVINHMGKLMLLTNPSGENQTLAIDLADLILYWERKARKQKKEILGNGDIEMKDNNAIRAKDDTTADGYMIPLSQSEACATFLIRYICVSNHRASETELGLSSMPVSYTHLDVYKRQP